MPTRTGPCTARSSIALRLPGRVTSRDTDRDDVDPCCDRRILR
ncbi:hypothetical protein [Xanthomonas fragariae]